MKKYFFKVSRIFMAIVSIFLIVIINTDTKVENQEKYNFMLKANHIFEKKSEETRKEVTTSQIANADKNEHIIDKSNMKGAGAAGG